MKQKFVPIFVTASFLLLSFASNSGVLKADCSPAKAGKNAAMKATVGEGGRCSPADAARDSAKGVTGIDGDDNGQGKDKGKPKGKDNDKDGDKEKDNKATKGMLKKVIK
jgi:hypothetical protein